MSIIAVLKILTPGKQRKLIFNRDITRTHLILTCQVSCDCIGDGAPDSIALVPLMKRYKL